MKIVIAPDSFKGSLSAAEAAGAMARAIHQVDEGIQVVLKPMADGGEGTLEALLASGGRGRIPIDCIGPLGEQIQTAYAVTRFGTAVIEAASIAGLTQVPPPKRNPDHTTTFGIGETITDALDKDCISFIIGIGGSATNDGGFGMLMALGMEAWDEQGRQLGPLGCDMLRAAKISFANLDPRLQSADIKVASDVDNPLCGERGATQVYGPQKGATVHQIELYDEALNHYGKLVEAELGRRFRELPGAGAAGGLGFALLALGAVLVSGAELVAEAIQVEEEIRDANLVLTGEGKSDEQTLYGKAPGYIASLAQKYDVPVILISGSLDANPTGLNERFTACFSIVNQPMPLEECMENAQQLLFHQTQQALRLVKTFSERYKE